MGPYVSSIFNLWFSTDIYWHLPKSCSAATLCGTLTRWGTTCRICITLSHLPPLSTPRNLGKEAELPCFMEYHGNNEAWGLTGIRMGYTLWWINIAMENGYDQFLVNFPGKNEWQHAACQPRVLPKIARPGDKMAGAQDNHGCAWTWALPQ